MYHIENAARSHTRLAWYLDGTSSLLDDVSCTKQVMQVVAHVVSAAHRVACSVKVVWVETPVGVDDHQDGPHQQQASERPSEQVTSPPHQLTHADHRAGEHREDDQVVDDLGEADGQRRHAVRDIVGATVPQVEGQTEATANHQRDPVATYRRRPPPGRTGGRLAVGVRRQAKHRRQHQRVTESDGPGQNTQVGKGGQRAVLAQRRRSQEQARRCDQGVADGRQHVAAGNCIDNRRVEPTDQPNGRRQPHQQPKVAQGHASFPSRGGIEQQTLTLYIL